MSHNPSSALLALLVLSIGVLGCQAKPAPGAAAEDDRDMTAMASGCAEQSKCDNQDTVCCNGEPCIDTRSDKQHCGGCGRTCAPVESCVDSQCVCRAGGVTRACGQGQTCCSGDSGGCKALQSDAQNCGVCGRACRSGETCSSGNCRCGAEAPCGGGQTCCGAACADLQKDSKNCGVCGKICPTGMPCENGQCKGECNPACMAPEVCCGGKCADVLRDSQNCGMCGKKCPDILPGFPAPCLLGFCFMLPDGGLPDL